MKATELLKKQHKHVAALFKALEKADEDDKPEVFEELASNLAAHDAIERQLFYPACEETLGMTEILGESLVEHGVVEFMLYRTSRAVGKPDFEYQALVLKENVEHHVKEEEGDLFPEVEKAFDDEQLEELGAQMLKLFERELKKDFRVAVRKQLKELLSSGGMKTGAQKKTSKRTTKNSSAKPRRGQGAHA